MDANARYIPELDGLRGLAVLFVLLAHSPFATFHILGPFGVTVFFILSGFLITRILIQEKQRGLPLRAFLVRRGSRIFPAYYLLLLVCGFWQGWDGMGYAALYVYNLSPIETVLPPHLGHTWSLCVEEQFYLLWPIAVAFLSLAASRRLAARLLVYGVILYPLFEFLAPAAGFGGRVDNLMYRATPFQAVPLLIGCLMAYGEQPLRANLSGRIIPAVLVAGVVLYVWNGQTGMVASELHLTIKSWNRIAAATMLFMVGLSPVAGGVLRFAPLRWCGVISYGLYLYHFPVYHGLLGSTSIWFTFPATFATATVSYYLYERPIRNIGYRWSSRLKRRAGHTDTQAAEPQECPATTPAR